MMSHPDSIGLYACSPKIQMATQEITLFSCVVQYFIADEAVFLYKTGSNVVPFPQNL